MLIGISGKISSGKDTVGKIIQYLVWKSRVEKGELPLSVYSFSDFARETSFGKNQSGFEIKKFADKLKDIVCLLIGYKREQLEDRILKEQELGEEWWYYKGRNNSLIPYNKNSKRSTEDLIKPTPRLLLQLIGTECIRDKVHPNAWVTALFVDYKVKWVPTGDSVAEEDVSLEKKYPNWIITDMRFLNELEAVKSRGGITIRVNRPYDSLNQDSLISLEKQNSTKNHPSETALDNVEFDYTIENNSSIEDLIHTVSLILKKEKII